MMVVLGVLTARPELIVAVPATRVPPNEPQLGLLLSQVAAREVARSVPAGTRVVSADDMTLLLGQERQRQLLGCSDGVECVTEIAAALNATETVSSSATLVASRLTGQQWVIEVKRVEGRTGLRLGSALVTLCGNTSTLLGAMSHAVHEAYGQKAPVTGDGQCPSTTAVIGVIGGSVLTLAGTAGTAVALVTKSAWDAQQLAGAQPTVSRADAQTAQVLFVGGLVTAGLGLAVVATSAIVLATKPTGPRLAVVPVSGGAVLTLGGAF